jgi:hypothetical protein
MGTIRYILEIVLRWVLHQEMHILQDRIPILQSNVTVSRCPSMRDLSSTALS